MCSVSTSVIFIPIPSFVSVGVVYSHSGMDSLITRVELNVSLYR